MKTLIIGYGNPGREDDGIGPAVADAVEKLNLKDITVDSDYQLNIEYAHDVSKFDLVIFVDASRECDEPFEMKKIQPALQITFTTHSINAESVLALCGDLYGKYPDAYMLAVRGYSFEMKEGLSDKAMKNTQKAVEFLAEFIGKMQL
ncbi:MAG TPA: hydrogenase maturation protease [Firmicutes bacterium]|nr:hydrogenase maturation protease [Bacillota bacterium]